MSAFSHSDWFLRARNNVVHELGHAFNLAVGGAAYAELAAALGENPLLVRGSQDALAYGFASRNDVRTWVQNRAATENEVFADQFLGWTFNTWEASADRHGGLTAAGQARRDWMTTNMTEWLVPPSPSPASTYE